MPIRNRILNKGKRIRYSFAYIQRSVLNAVYPESVYFYTFHKCASTLFSKYILENVNGLLHIDYARQIYSGHRDVKKPLTFKQKGFIYGPIRISADKTGPVGRLLVKPTIQHNFVRDKIALFFVRDPRDILVSSYYSFGFTHGLSKVAEIRERQETNRRVIRKQTIDEYVLQSAEKQVDFFKTLYDLSVACERSVVMRYEDMINDFDTFASQLTRYISIHNDVLQAIYEQTRPKKKEDPTSHRRSGRVQGFRDKLKNSTIESLNKKLADTLILFGYEA